MDTRTGRSRLPRFSLVLALATSVLLLLGACGSTDDGDGDPGSGAAEPARSPRLTEEPAGTVVPVGAKPQGIAFDPRTGTVAVAVHDPYRILLLDPTTLSVRTTVPLPGKARHLTNAAPGGPILVPDETADQLIEVFLPSGSTRTTAVGHHPHNSIAEPNGDILVANEFSHTISRVRDGKVVVTVPGVDQPGGLAEDGDRVAAVDVHDFTVKVFDRETLVPLGSTPVGAGPTHGVLTSRHRVVVIDTRGDRAYVLSLDPLKVLGSTALPGSPYGVDADPVTGEVWVTLTARNELVGLSLATDVPRVFARYPTVRQPDTVAVSPGGRTLWVTGTRDGVVQRIAR